ncbi:hypothetical protein [Agromyces seonyuensis]|uniref:Histidinol dehydrogenase n=1 Tax=Agromyces seonyuensis TaxID=2662446 RepID=A0A6I4P1W3_9MICO|nr:hypothetical protein [Agromyces seonyuensis]MWB99552.1 hypothetical protein [Agromyces seonyuensis]
MSGIFGGRWGEGLLGLVLGLLYGFIATIGHQQVWRIGDVVLPWGLVLAILGAGALVAALRLSFESRLGSIGGAVGLVGMVALLTLPGAGGSVLVPNNLLGMVWVVAPALIAAIVLAWPRLPQRRGS